jgi:multisubunit Na+/H+ antiporter MnhE subunit
MSDDLTKKAVLLGIDVLSAAFEVARAAVEKHEDPATRLLEIATELRNDVESAFKRKFPEG